MVGRQGHLGRLKAANPGMRVVMTGCSVRESNRSGLARRYPAVDLFLRPDEEPELVDRLGLASAQAPVGAMATTAATTLVKGSPVSDATHLVRARAEALASGAVSRGSAISAWLPIIYGCDKTCTYCIVPFSRGPERSRPFDEILDEARALAARGFREVTLLGQNVNSYGHDLPAEERFAHVSTARTVGRQQDREARPDLAELIRAIDGLRTADGAPAIPRLRFVTSHPWDLSDRLVEALADCPSVCESLHLPVQSGSDSMLRRMGRQYTIDHYLERLDRIRAAVPGISLSTDVIVGFCGETEAEYEATLDLLRTVRFDQVFAAAYSERPGTPATKLADDVPAIEKRRRLVGLLGVQEAIGLERNLAWLGRTTEVLVDTIVPPRTHDHDEDGAAEAEVDAAAASRDAFARLPEGLAHLSGRSRENKLVHVAGSPNAARHELVDVRDRARGAVRPPRPAGLSAGVPLAPLIVIGGPTATGKTALAIAIAERLLARGIPAEIVSADSRQVYRGLDIGTAKATSEERARVVHHGLDLVDADQPYSVADFRPHALAALEALGARGGVGILAGGTGFWLRAVFAGIDTDALPSDEAVRAALEEELARDGVDALAARLAALAPGLAATTDLRNPRRVVRALEIATLQGDAPLPRPVGYPAPVLGSSWASIPPSTGAGSRSGHAPSSTPGWWRRPVPCASASTRPCRRSRPSGTGRAGRSSTASWTSRPRSSWTRRATWPSPSASAPGSAGSPRCRWRTPPAIRSRRSSIASTRSSPTSAEPGGRPGRTRYPWTP